MVGATAVGASAATPFVPSVASGSGPSEPCLPAAVQTSFATINSSALTDMRRMKIRLRQNLAFIYWYGSCKDRASSGAPEKGFLFLSMQLQEKLLV